MCEFTKCDCRIHVAVGEYYDISKVYFAQAKYFKCFFSYAKRSFQRAINSVFGKDIGRYPPRNPIGNFLMCADSTVWYRNTSSQKSDFK